MQFSVELCGLFWSLPAKRVNTTIHKMSHFLSLLEVILFVSKVCLLLLSLTHEFRNRSNQESKFDFLATRQQLGKIDRVVPGQWK